MSEKATFGAGCFWGVEMRFRQMPGVTDATVGYMGGSVDNPTYKQVCSDQTGHAEVCEVAFDPDRISFEALVRSFFELHDPTQVNRQGPDVGTQYRSVIFVHDDEQRQVAERVRSELDAGNRFSAPIATSIEPAAAFWPAEDYHQQYLAKNGGSCAITGS
ncbi:MAG: peptide-methionine (S)-S-oxide reductase MsrA [Gammaproteobacteria bacterium]|jgi:peptide-methionine (S)-S-oxide reductase|nr:peptide-methionine (S)-S-oxide reductase MsrA [Gammaproteobacteria bacterium]